MKVPMRETQGAGAQVTDTSWAQSTKVQRWRVHKIAELTLDRVSKEKAGEHGSNIIQIQ